MIRRVGALLAELHSIAVEPQGEMVRWLTKRQAGADWCHAHDLVEKLEEEWASMLADSLTTIIELNEIGADPQPAGLVLSHTCLDHSTVRLGPEGSLRVTQWDWAGPITPSSELVTAAWTWGTDGHGSIDPRRVAALVDGYRSVAGSLPPVELESCGPMISAWLNQLAGSMARATWASKDPAVRKRASHEVISMLENPLSRRRCEELVRLIE